MKSLEKIQINPDPIYITVFVNLLISESATQTELFEKINELLELNLPRDTIKSLLAAVSTKKNGKFITSHPVASEGSPLGTKTLRNHNFL